MYKRARTDEPWAPPAGRHVTQTGAQSGTRLVGTAHAVIGALVEMLHVQPALRHAAPLGSAHGAVHPFRIVDPGAGAARVAFQSFIDEGRRAVTADEVEERAAELGAPLPPRALWTSAFMRVDALLDDEAHEQRVAIAAAQHPDAPSVELRVASARPVATLTLCDDDAPRLTCTWHVGGDASKGIVLRLAEGGVVLVNESTAAAVVRSVPAPSSPARIAALAALVVYAIDARHTECAHAAARALGNVDAAALARSVTATRACMRHAAFAPLVWIALAATCGAWLPSRTHIDACVRTTAECASISDGDDGEDDKGANDCPMLAQAGTAHVAALLMRASFGGGSGARTLQQRLRRCAAANTAPVVPEPVVAGDGEPAWLLGAHTWPTLANDALAELPALALDLSTLRAAHGRLRVRATEALAADVCAARHGGAHVDPLLAPLCAKYRDAIDRLVVADLANLVGAM